jgi:hypothetical protein
MYDKPNLGLYDTRPSVLDRTASGGGLYDIRHTPLYSHLLGLPGLLWNTGQLLAAPRMLEISLATNLAPASGRVGGAVPLAKI